MNDDMVFINICGQWLNRRMRPEEVIKREEGKHGGLGAWRVDRPSIFR